jgi:hypothetical protein
LTCLPSCAGALRLPSCIALHVQVFGSSQMSPPGFFLSVTFVTSDVFSLFFLIFDRFVIIRFSRCSLHLPMHWA